MTRQEKRALIERLHDIWSTGDIGSIHEVYAEDFVAHMPKGWGAAPSRDGRDGIRRAIERLRAGFPDWREHIDDMVIDGDKVAVRYHSTGTHLGAFAGQAASGRRVEGAGITHRCPASTPPSSHPEKPLVQRNMSGTTPVKLS